MRSASDRAGQLARDPPLHCRHRWPQRSPVRGHDPEKVRGPRRHTRQLTVHGETSDVASSPLSSTSNDTIPPRVARRNGFSCKTFSRLFCFLAYILPSSSVWVGVLAERRNSTAFGPVPNRWYIQNAVCLRTAPLNKIATAPDKVVNLRWRFGAEGRRRGGGVIGADGHGPVDVDASAKLMMRSEEWWRTLIFTNKKQWWNCVVEFCKMYFCAWKDSPFLRIDS